jgi:hypothetical protein
MEHNVAKENEVKIRSKLVVSSKKSMAIKPVFLDSEDDDHDDIFT